MKRKQNKTPAPKIRDLVGRVIYQDNLINKAGTTFQVETGNFASGTYMATFYSGAASKTLKFIKQ